MSQSIEIKAIRSRPRFKVFTNMPPDIFLAKLKIHLKDRAQILDGYIRSDLSVVYLKKFKDTFGAPQLQLQAETEEGQTVIRGVFGPAPAVWTFFIFLYSTGLFLVFGLGTYGWIEQSLGTPSVYLWAIPVGFLVILGTYIAAKIGQRIGKDQMDTLRLFIERVLVGEMILKEEEEL